MEKEISIRTLQKLLTNKSFNPYIDIKNQDKVILHLAEEIGEFISVYRKGLIVEMKHELGDIQILLAFVCSSLGYDLEDCLMNKLKWNINTGRFRPDKPLEEYL